MTLDDYAAWAATLPAPKGPAGDLDGALAYLGLGLAGEAGEVADLIKTALRDGRPADPAALADELGDVAYDWVRLCAAAGVTPQDVLAGSRAKIAARVSAASRPASA